MADHTSFCAACGAETAQEQEHCPACHEMQMDFTTCRNKDCTNTCHQKFCVPCHVKHKRVFRRCLTSNCPGETKYEFCRKCNWKRNQRQRQTRTPRENCPRIFPEGEGNLGSEWSPCTQCGESCPKMLCRQCYQKQTRSRNQTRNQTRNQSRKKDTPLRQCNGLNCQNMTHSQFCEICHDFMGQYIYRRPE